MSQNILFTCAGRRNYLINYFKEVLKGDGNVLAADKSLTAPALVDADVAIQLPGISDENYIDRLIEEIIQHHVTAVISLNDLELPILSKHKTKIEATGAKVIISNETVIDITFDKWKTHQFLLDCGLNSPKSYIDLEETVKDLRTGRLEFPVVIKPRWGSASIGITYAYNMEELNLLYNLQVLQLRKKGQDHDNGLIIQEKLDGIEYGMDVLNDFNGNYYGSFAREKLSMRSGETDKAKSVISSDLSRIGSKLGNSLKHIGNMDCDVFKCKDDFYVLELNPRFGGGYPFSHEAGINTCAIYIDWLNDQKLVDQHNEYEADITFSKCDRMLKISKSK